jgi:ubiquinone/menaquinone biosynthesis C-methylase UbiE
MSDQTDSRLHDLCTYEVEIAAKLRNASRAERTTLYGQLYDTYLAAFPECMPASTDHPDQNVGYELAFAKQFMTPNTVVAEVGPGRCDLAFALAGFCRSVYGLDVIDMSPVGAAPSNFKLLLTDGTHIPLPDESVGVVISNQMMEHLHPDDALEQLNEVRRILIPGGCYICNTPNRLHGPYDSSACFDDLPVVDGTYVATGLHLKEYTNMELSQLFQSAGFRRCKLFAGARGTYVQVPSGIMALTEQLIRRIPVKLRKRSRVLQVFLGVRIVSEK